MFCLEQPEINKLKKAIEKNGKKLSEMTTSERIDVFADGVSLESAKVVNTSFEKALISTKVGAVEKWVEKTFTPAEKKQDIYKDIKAEIDNMTELMDNPNSNFEIAENAEDNIIASVLESQFGFNVSKSEFKELSDMVEELQKLDKPHPDLPEGLGIKDIEFYKQRERISKYIRSKNPSSKIDVALGLVGRSSMLLSANSYILNQVSTAGNTIVTNLANGGYVNSKYSNKDLTKAWSKAAKDIYKVSGIDITRTKNIQEVDIVQGEELVSIEGVRFKIDDLADKIGLTKSQLEDGKTLTEAYTDLVFQEILGKPDSMWARNAYLTTANNYSVIAAKAEGGSDAKIKARAREILEGVLSIETTVGKDNDSIESRIKEISMEQAMIATFTENGTLAKHLVKGREAIDLGVGIKIGEAFIPFLKTPANIIEQGVKYGTGFEVYRSINNWVAISNKHKNANTAQEKALRNVEMRHKVFNPMIRSGVFMTVAAMIISSIDMEDYIKDYKQLSPKERRLVKARGLSYNSLNFDIAGQKLSISTEYLGIMAPIVKAGLTTKLLSNDNILDKVFYYGKISVIGAVAESPVVEDVVDFFKSNPFAKSNEAESAADTLERLATNTVDFASARFIPAFSYALAQTISSQERDQYSQSVVGPFLKRVPGLNFLLEPKHDAFGRVIEDSIGEKVLTVLPFGSRVKIEETNEVLEEYNKLNIEGYLPVVSDPRYTKNKKVANLIENASDKVQAQWYIDFAKKWEDDAYKTISRKAYQNKTPEERMKELNKVRTKALDFSLIKYSKYTR